MLAIWSLVPLPFLKPAWTSGSSQLMYCWSLAWRILSMHAKSRQLCSTLCDPIDGGPPGSCPWDSPGKHTGVGCHFLLQFEYVDRNKLWKILKEMGICDHLTCTLRNLYAGQEATVRMGHGTTDWFQIGKGVHQGCIFSPAYLIYLQRTSWEMPG